MEVWKDVVGYEGLYQVSNMGRVKSFYHDTIHGQILKPAHNGYGYLQVVLCQDGKRSNKFVHRLVLEAHVGLAPSPAHEGNHKNGIRDDPRAENLEWVTRSENHRHAYRVLGREAAPSKGEANGRSILTSRKVVEIRRLYATGKYLQRELAEMFGVTHQTISQIIRRKHWKHVP